jgi:arsenite methyltransferase
MLNEIQARYTEESSKNCNLSCGSNLEYLELVSGETILDLGCGRGRETILAADRVGPGGQAVGLDITQAMIDQAKAQAKLTSKNNIKFVLGDIENLPFEDATFHAVMSNCVINHARSKRRAYTEIQRVLKPGGRFVISDAVTKMPLPESIKNDPQAWAECFGGAVTQEEYLASILDAGFAQVQILHQREYNKNGYDFVSLTIMGHKQV